jgi:hypothetical protein
MIRKLRHNKARMIQRWFIAQHAKNSMIGKLLDFRQVIIAREGAAKLINPIVRGGVVRLRLARIKREEEEERERELEIARQLQEEEIKKAEAEAKKNKGFFSRFKNAVHLEELNPMTLQKHKHAAVVIQKHMRRCLAKTIVAQREMEKKIEAVSRMQKKFKLYSFRKARWAATMALEKIWVKVKKKRRFKARMITKVQSQ